jgi:hypothetical protein
MICKSFCVDNIVTLPNITAWITVTLYDVSHLTVICSNLADNNLSGEIPKRLLQVSHYRYGQGYILQTILRLVLHNTDNCNSSYIGNHLNCGQHLISCEGNNINTGNIEINMAIYIAPLIWINKQFHSFYQQVDQITPNSRWLQALVEQ